MPKPPPSLPSRALRLAKHPSRVYDKLVAKLPPKVAGRLDLFLRPSFRSPTGGPLNGQAERQRIVKQLFDTIPLQTIVETGTFRGSSAKYFTKHFRRPLFTVEMHPRYFAYSRLRMRVHRSVHVRQGDSREFLRALAREGDVPKRGVFFYLDAHWGKELPLRDEVQIITDAWSDIVILIDDFQVPDDDGYGFDDYGEGLRLTADYLPDGTWSRYVALYPVASSAEETGKKRGCIVLISKGFEHLVPELTRLRELPARTASA